MILGANPAAPRRRLSRLFYCEGSKINGDNRSQIKIAAWEAATAGKQDMVSL